MQEDRLEKIDISYDQIPWYRKRWFIVVTILLFAPATILICATGDLYAKRDGSVYKYSKTIRMLYLVVAVFFTFQGVTRLIK